MPLPALPDALSKGVIDGFLLPWEVIPSVKAHEMVKFHSETDPASRALYTALFILAMNQKRYDSLPADLKKVIDDNSGAALSQHFGKTWDESASRPRRKLAVDRGNTFYTIPSSELVNWEKATAGIYDEWVKDVTAKGNDGKALLQNARDLIKKYEEVAAVLRHGAARHGTRRLGVHRGIHGLPGPAGDCRAAGRPVRPRAVPRLRSGRAVRQRRPDPPRRDRAGEHYGSDLLRQAPARRL